MPKDLLDTFKTFVATVAKATNETQKREAFLVLAATGFEDAQFATDLALGAEYQVRFKASGTVRRGVIDAFYGNLIVEFEYDLPKSREHALDQLRNYVAGAWTEDRSATRPYLAVASDGLNWEVFSARLADPTTPVAVENIVLEPVES